MRFNFKKFREEDMHNPEFYVGQLFSSIDMLRKAINKYSCKNRVDIKKQPMRVQCWVQSVKKMVVLGTCGFLRIVEQNPSWLRYIMESTPAGRSGWSGHSLKNF